MNVYDIFYSICLGLFIGGIIMSIISIVLAEMSTHDSNADHVDKDFGHVDHVDKDFGHVDHVDKDFGHVDHVDNQNEMGDSNILDDTTPAPFMLLFSTSLLFFGIIGMLLSYYISDIVRFLAFFITPATTYMIVKSVSIGWKKMAKSKYYRIAPTKNLIGKEGEVVLDVDANGGVIKIISDTPLKFEKLHVKPLKPDSKFEEGTKVYICDVRQGYLLVDNNKKLIRR